MFRLIACDFCAIPMRGFVISLCDFYAIPLRCQCNAILPTPRHLVKFGTLATDGLPGGKGYTPDDKGLHLLWEWWHWGSWTQNPGLLDPWILVPELKILDPRAWILDPRS